MMEEEERLRSTNISILQKVNNRDHNKQQDDRSSAGYYE